MLSPARTDFFVKYFAGKYNYFWWLNIKNNLKMGNNKKPDVPTAVVKNTIPEMLLGVTLTDRWGIGVVFTTDNQQKTYLQVQPILQVLESNTNNVIGEFRTVASYLIDINNIDDGFYKMAHSFILSAISEFDGKLKENKSFLTMYKTYAAIPSFENNKEAIRKAYVLAGFGRPSNN